MFCLYNTSNLIHLLSFFEKKVTKKNYSAGKSFRYLKSDAVTAPAAPLTVVARRAYHSLALVNRSLFAGLTALYLLRESRKYFFYLTFFVLLSFTAKESKQLPIIQFISYSPKKTNCFVIYYNVTCILPQGE